MKECVSMYLGGDVVSSDDCDYESYKELGLTCPFCHKPVFLRAGSEFVREDGKKVIRDSCFAHFKIDNETGEVCEKRSISKEGVAEIREIERKAKNQRLRLFETCFVDLLICNNPDEEFKKDIASIGNGILPDWVQTKNEVVDKYFKKIAKQNVHVFRRICINAISLNIEDEMRKAENIRGYEPSNFTKIRSDIVFQKKVIQEVLYFLGSSCSEKMLYQLIWVAFILQSSNTKNFSLGLDNREIIPFLSSIATSMHLLYWRKSIEIFRIRNIA